MKSQKVKLKVIYDMKPPREGDMLTLSPDFNLLTGSPLEMSCTIEKALADAKALVERLRDHDDAAESLIEQTTALSKRVEAMKQV